MNQQFDVRDRPLIVGRNRWFDECGIERHEDWDHLRRGRRIDHSQRQSRRTFVIRVVHRGVGPGKTRRQIVGMRMPMNDSLMVGMIIGFVDVFRRHERKRSNRHRQRDANNNRRCHRRHAMRLKRTPQVKNV